MSTARRLLAVFALAIETDALASPASEDTWAAACSARAAREAQAGTVNIHDGGIELYSVLAKAPYTCLNDWAYRQHVQLSWGEPGDSIERLTVAEVRSCLSDREFDLLPYKGWLCYREQPRFGWVENDFISLPVETTGGAARVATVRAATAAEERGRRGVATYGSGVVCHPASRLRY